MTPTRHSLLVGLLAVVLLLLAVALSSAEARRSDPNLDATQSQRSVERRAMYRRYTEWKEDHNVMHEVGSEEDLDTFANYEDNMENLRHWRERVAVLATNQATIGNVTIYNGPIMSRTLFLNAVASILNTTQIQSYSFGSGVYDMAWFNVTRAMFLGGKWAMPNGSPNITNPAYFPSSELLNVVVCYNFNYSNPSQCANSQTNWRSRMGTWVANNRPMPDGQIYAQRWLEVTLQMLGSYDYGVDPRCAAEAGNTVLDGTNIDDYNALYNGLITESCRNDQPSKRSDDEYEDIDIAHHERDLSVWTPAAYDWHNTTFTRSGSTFKLSTKFHVQNQGKCNGCWAFTVAEHFGVLNTIVGGDAVYMAADQFMYCSRVTTSTYTTAGDPLWTKMMNYGSTVWHDEWAGTPNDVDPTLSCPFYPNMPHWQIQNVAHNAGKVYSVNMWSTTAQYIYHGLNTQCWGSTLSLDYSTNGKSYSSGYGMIQYGDEMALYARISPALTTYASPVISAIDATQTSFVLYKRGTYYDPACSRTKLSHTITVWGIGYDDCGAPYWVVRNSWGVKWGLDGEMKMIARRNQCGIATYATYAIVS